MDQANTPSANNVFIKCPECGKVLQFKAFPNYQKAKLTCPFCKYQNSIENYVSIKTPSQQLQPQPPLDGDGDTEDLDATRTPGSVQLRCVDTGATRTLREGLNTIGRSSATPQATVTFDDPQKYLSRNHATINVVATGKGLSVRLQDNGSKNGTFINNTRLSSGTIVAVQNGGMFTMGRLRFVVEITSRSAGPRPGGNSPATELI